MSTLHTEERTPASGNTRRLVVFLHGYGADGHDLLSLGEMMDLPDTHYLSPHAPFPCEMSPFGRQWFSLADRSPEAMEEGVQTAAPLLDDFLDAQMARFSLPPSQIALVGFSQGCMMALYTATRRHAAPGAIVGLSGALVGANSLMQEGKSKPPICLIHGSADEVVPYGALAHARDHLRHYGCAVETHTRFNLGHGIDEAALAHAETFLKRHLF